MCTLIFLYTHTIIIHFLFLKAYGAKLLQWRKIFKQMTCSSSFHMTILLWEKHLMSYLCLQQWAFLWKFKFPKFWGVLVSFRITSAVQFTSSHFTELNCYVIMHHSSFWINYLKSWYRKWKWFNSVVGQPQSTSKLNTANITHTLWKEWEPLVQGVAAMMT
jgi:hypothetical protein